MTQQGVEPATFVCEGTRVPFQQPHQKGTEVFKVAFKEKLRTNNYFYKNFPMRFCVFLPIDVVGFYLHTFSQT